jgi:hypothetical protein
VVGVVARSKRSVEPAPLEQVEQRELGPQAELEGDVAELDVEVDQAGLAPLPASLCANRIASWLSARSLRPRRRS